MSIWSRLLAPFRLANAIKTAWEWYVIVGGSGAIVVGAYVTLKAWATRDPAIAIILGVAAFGACLLVLVLGRMALDVDENSSSTNNTDAVGPTGDVPFTAGAWQREYVDRLPKDGPAGRANRQDTDAKQAVNDFAEVYMFRSGVVYDDAMRSIGIALQFTNRGNRSTQVQVSAVPVVAGQRRDFDSRPTETFVLTPTQLQESVFLVMASSEAEYKALLKGRLPVSVKVDLAYENRHGERIEYRYLGDIRTEPLSLSTIREEWVKPETPSNERLLPKPAAVLVAIDGEKAIAISDRTITVVCGFMNVGGLGTVGNLSHRVLMDGRDVVSSQPEVFEFAARGAQNNARTRKTTFEVNAAAIAGLKTGVIVIVVISEVEYEESPSRRVQYRHVGRVDAQRLSLVAVSDEWSDITQ